MDLYTEGGVMAGVLVVVSVAKSVFPIAGRGTVLVALLSGIGLATLGYFTKTEGFALVGLVSALFTGAQAGLAAVGLKVAGAAAVDRMPSR